MAHLPLEEFGLVQPQQEPQPQPMNNTINIELHGQDSNKPTDFPALAYHHVQQDEYDDDDYNEQYLTV